MSWKQIIPGGKQRSTLGVTMAYRLGHGLKDRRSFFVYLGRDVMDQLHWELNQPVAVYFGQGEHASRLRIAPAAMGTMKIRNVGGSNRKLGVIFQPPPGLGAEVSHFSEPVDYEVRAGGVEVTLPIWARPTIKSQTYRDVSGALMGDPKRRAS